MKRIYFAYSLLLVLATACGSKQTTGGVSIEGNIKGLGNDTLYLYGADRFYDRVDTLVVTGDRFTVTLFPDTLVATWLRFGDGTEYPVFMRPDDRLQIRGTADATDALEVTGSQPNEELTAFHRGMKEPGADGNLEQLADSFITSHPTSLVSIYLLEKYFVQQPEPDYRLIRQLTDGMAGELKDRPYVDALLALLKEGEKTDIGKIAPTFRISNAEGTPIYRTSFKDKYLLIHFWASWDTLSRRENALYRRIYRKERKNERFVMLGVSLDTDKASWKEAIGQDTLEWEQGCDFNGWNGAGIVKQFALQTIPSNVLLAPSGRVEGRNLDEAAIEQALEDIAQKEKKEQGRKKR